LRREAQGLRRHARERRADRGEREAHRCAPGLRAATGRGGGIMSEEIQLASGSFEELQELFEKRGWGGGLPRVPPPPERVCAMLAPATGPPPPPPREPIR